MNTNPEILQDSLLLKDFLFDLPDEKIARYPLEQRDQSRLLVYKNREIVHRRFSDIPEELPAESFLVFNDTRVIPARAYFQKSTGAKIEILFLQPELPSRNIQEAMMIRKSCVWACMIGNKKRWKKGEVLTTSLQVKDQDIIVSATYADYEYNHVQLEWSDEELTFLDIITALGTIPLPPYLNRETEESDNSTYQTIYAAHKGAVAAPTAGLHFTEEVFDKLKSKGIDHSFLTLHVGAGTFQPIKVSTVNEHIMHKEQVVYSRDLVVKLMENLGNIVAVGTTSLRSLESLYWFGAELITKGKNAQFYIDKNTPYQQVVTPETAESLKAVLNYMEENFLDELWGETGIFVYPGYSFRLVDGLITNYHQPGSTLILLIAAFTGEDWRKIYKEALDNDYRFLSYGDSSLLWKAN